MNMNDENTTERMRNLKQANANQAIEGNRPDESDKKIQDKFMAGQATTDDLLQHAKDFAAEITGRKKT